RLSFPESFLLFNSNVEAIKQALTNAPERFQENVAGVIISLPNADGNMERFEVFEASNFEPELQAKYPQIRSYVGSGIDDKLATLRMSVDPSGIQTIVFRTGK